MRAPSRSTLLGLLCLSLLAAPTPALSLDTVVELTYTRTPIGGGAPTAITQRLLLLDLADAPAAVPVVARAVAVLFPGGGGRLGMTPASPRLNIAQTNFVVQTRHHWAAQGLHVVVVDAASDFLARPQGLGADRTSAQHMRDVEEVVLDLRSRFPGLPIWLVGTSRGTISAASAAAVLTGAAAPDGLVLTSSLTRPAPAPGNPESLQDVALEAIHVPSLVVAHRDDACQFTPPEDANALFHTLKAGHRRSRLRFFEGGFAALDGPCDPLSPHGFFGIEPRVIESIARFITGGQ